MIKLAATGKMGWPLLKGPTVISCWGQRNWAKPPPLAKWQSVQTAGQKGSAGCCWLTFRAGAIEQLNVWAERDGVDIVKKPEKVIHLPWFTMHEKVKSKTTIFCLLTLLAGCRTRPTMNELAKMKRVIAREIPDAPHEVSWYWMQLPVKTPWIKLKCSRRPLMYVIVLTKLDGTARGGIVLAIRNELHLPVSTSAWVNTWMIYGRSNQANLFLRFIQRFDRR